MFFVGVTKIHPHIQTYLATYFGRHIYITTFNITYFRKIQSVLQKDNVDQHRALYEERRRAEEATERAKEIIKVK